MSKYETAFWLAECTMVSSNSIILFVLVTNRYYSFVVAKFSSALYFAGLKGRVTNVHSNGTIADVEMRDSGDVLRLPHTELETVIPIPGGRVIVVQGTHRGRLGTLERINESRFNGDIRLDGDTAPVALPYEDFCKVGTK
jgi:hypothetical protein